MSLSRIAESDVLAADADLVTRIVNCSDHPLLGKPAAAVFHQICLSSNDGFADARRFVGAHAEFSKRDCVDVFLADQLLRWNRGVGLPAEVYCDALRDRFDGALVAEMAELVCHELALHLACSIENSKPQLDDYCARFPDLGDMLHARFGRPAATPSSGSTTSIAAPSFPPTAIDPVDNCGSTRIDTESDSGSDWSSIEPSILGSVIESPVRLGKYRPFSLLPHVILSKLEQEVRELSFKPGQHLIQQGAQGDGLFVIEAGSVEISLRDATGQRQPLGASSAGEIIGEMSLLTDEPRTADVIAKDDVRTLFLPQQAFERIAAQHPIVSRMLTALLADRLGQHGRDALSGKVLAGYRIARRLGKGGMAIVYQAEELASGQTVALKMMSHRLVYDARALRMFENEARVIRAFDHPHIVRMLGRFDAFRSYFLVMEFCEGVSLEDIVRNSGALSEGGFRRTIGQVAAALAYAHSRQIVHRDIKPSNVMQSATGLVKLMDFGLANPVEDLANAERTISGTLQYMAPEQLRGDPIDQRADLFALGCTAYRLLTGKSLISGRTVLAVRQQHEQWEVPSFVDFPRDIAAFMRRCLNPDPNARLVDLEEIARWANCD